MLFRHIILMFFVLFPIGAYADKIVATPEEEKAFLEGMRGMMERLSDPQWMQLMQENADGCWIDKNTLIDAGEEQKINDVPSRCVPIEVMPGQQSYIFVPIGVLEQCDKAQIPYNQCLNQVNQ